MRTLLGVLGLFVVGLLVDQGLAWVSSNKREAASRPVTVVDTRADVPARLEAARADVPIAPSSREVALRRRDVSAIRP